MGISRNILTNGDKSALGEAAMELYEWLSLVRLQSPRVALSDAIDSYLARYTLPSHGTETETNHMQICMISWQGFISSKWLRKLFQNTLDACRHNQWFSISATGFSESGPASNSDLMMLSPPGSAGEYLMWEIRNSS